MIERPPTQRPAVRGLGVLVTAQRSLGGFRILARLPRGREQLHDEQLWRRLGFRILARTQGIKGVPCRRLQTLEVAQGGTNA